MQCTGVCFIDTETEIEWDLTSVYWLEWNGCDIGIYIKHLITGGLLSHNAQKLKVSSSLYFILMQIFMLIWKENFKKICFL